MNKQPKLDAFLGLVDTGVATCDLNKFLGSVLEKITLVLGGTSFIRSNITLIELKANGKVIFQTSGANLHKSNLYSATGYGTVLKLDFMNRKARTTNAWQAGAIDLSAASGITSLRLEVTTSGADAPTLTGFADLSPPTADPAEQSIRWLIARRHRATQVIGGAGEFAINVPHIDPSGGGSTYRKIFIYSEFLESIKTVREGITEHDISDYDNRGAQIDNGLTPQTNLFVFDPCQDGQLQGRTWDTRPAVGVRSAQFYGTFSEGETITIETEELLPLAAY